MFNRILLESIQSPDDDKIRFRIVFILWILIGFMVPIWIGLSLVYRSPLPYENIKILNQKTTAVRINVGLILPKASSNQDVIIKSIQSSLNSAMAGNSIIRPVVFSASSIKEPSEPGLINLIVSCPKSISKSKIVIDADRKAVLELADCSSQYITNTIVTLLSSLFIQEQNSFALMSSNAQGSDISTMKYSSEYQLIFSLLVANPNDGIVSWEADKAIQSIQPLLAQFSNITSFVVSSQIQNYATLPHFPAKKSISGKEYFALSPFDLTHFINSAEWNLDSLVSPSPAIHFVLYIPPQDYTPLQILHSDGSLLNTNAFLIPQWGGIKIENISLNDKKEKRFLYPQNLHSIMQVYAEQFRTLMGVERLYIPHQSSIFPNFEITIKENPKLGITGWEIDRVLRQRTVKNIENTVNTLQSLERLLSSLETIVVQDHITTLVDESIQSLEIARNGLEDCNYNAASRASRNAIINAEKAFFDPTMVALLYFPAQHLLAIYMPFFVPIAVPMITALRKEYQIWRASRIVKVKSD